MVGTTPFGQEGTTLEFRSAKEGAKDIARTICAFANTEGGRIYFGVANDGTVIGIPPSDVDEVQLTVSTAAQQVVPRPFIKVDLQRHEGERVVVAKVLPFGAGTLCSLGGSIYYRHGSAVTKLEGKTLQDYLVTRYILDFGEQLSSAGMDDVNAERLRSFLSVRSPEIAFDKTKVRSYLDGLGVTTMVDGGPRLKNVGVLFFGTEPSKFIMQAEIRIARFRGTTPVDIIDAQYIAATIPEALKAAEDFVKRNTRVAFVIEGMRRKDVPEYPEKVVREVLVNALAHRDYFSRDSVQVRIFDDRLEVVNPGKLPMELNVHDLGTMSVQRNPLAYRLLRDLGLVEGSSTGIPRIRSTLMKEGYPEPSFEELGSFFRVIVRNKDWRAEPELNERQRRALERLKEKGSVAAAELAKEFAVSNNIAVSDLNGLSELGLVRRIGKTRGARYVLENEGPRNAPVQTSANRASGSGIRSRR